MAYKLTDAQIKALKARLYNIGREKLIDRLENAMINANSLGNTTAAARYEASIEWARKRNDWVIDI